MHVLITGAGGFSGSNLVMALLAQGHTVTALSGRGQGRRDRGNFRHPLLTVVFGDLAECVALPRDIDAVVHAAARSPAPGVGACDFVRDNAMGTARLIEHAREAGAQTFVYLSSLSVNGTITDAIVDESTAIVDPDAYGASKYLGELMLREEPSFRSLAIRLPGIIGKASVRNWLTSVLEAAQAGRAIRIYNAESDYNNAVHVDDLCGFVGKVLADPGWNGHDVVTIGANTAITVRGAVEILLRALGSSSVIEVKPAHQRGFIISNRRAQEVYGYAPMDIETMLVRFASENRREVIHS